MHIIEACQAHAFQHIPSSGTLFLPSEHRLDAVSLRREYISSILVSNFVNHDLSELEEAVVPSKTGTLLYVTNHDGKWFVGRNKILRKIVLQNATETQFEKLHLYEIDSIFLHNVQVMDIPSVVQKNNHQLHPNIRIKPLNFTPHMDTLQYWISDADGECIVKGTDMAITETEMTLSVSLEISENNGPFSFGITWKKSDKTIGFVGKFPFTLE